MDKVEINTIFLNNNTATTRGHKYKIYKKHCRTNRRKYSFSQRVVAHWNALPESVIDVTSVNSFKNRPIIGKILKLNLFPTFTDRKRVLVEMIM
jgi:hypothetical protein